MSELNSCTSLNGNRKRGKGIGRNRSTLWHTAGHILISKLTGGLKPYRINPFGQSLSLSTHTHKTYSILARLLSFPLAAMKLSVSTLMRHGHLYDRRTGRLATRQYKLFPLPSAYVYNTQPFFFSGKKIELGCFFFYGSMLAMTWSNGISKCTR